MELMKPLVISNNHVISRAAEFPQKALGGWVYPLLILLGRIRPWPPSLGAESCPGPHWGGPALRDGPFSDPPSLGR